MMSVISDSDVRPPGVSIQRVLGYMGLQLRGDTRARSAELVIPGEGDE